ncbi:MULTISPECIES: hypothetical protein [Flavobacterium]|uniref:Lipocalin-like domain-containing protein n=1 Tax=Flavobacterium quisquiliarum TaxID=1834436 RepID=A0ABV8WD68_9FLAO|nr:MULTISPECIES: hypothetical protein [Flavobacterium]MBW1658271.1 hypothetical protein [Flavobacterium quisquiliarum]
MEKVFLLICITILADRCNIPPKEFTLIGKWKAIESSGLDVSKMFYIDIEDGEEITFEKGNIAIDHLKNKGTYEVFENNLHIVFPKDEYYYIISRHETDPDKMYLTPTDEYYSILCDEGCAFLYKKIQ